MVGFLRKAHPIIFQVRFPFTLSSSSNILPHFPFLLHLYFCTSSSSSKAQAQAQAQAQSFTVSHLTNSYGFSHQEALSAYKFIGFKTPEKLDSFFAFFNDHGFSKSQTSKIVRSRPQLLLSNAKKSFLPKLQFFYSNGASESDVARILVSIPSILHRSLINRIIPSYNFLKDFFQSEEMAMGVVKHCPRVLLFDLQTYVTSNINALREFGVPKSNIASLLRNQPRTLMVKPDQFRKVLEEVKEMGIDPSKLTFVWAVQAIRGLSKSNWNRKIKAYERWGLSKEDIHLAFLKYPWCMLVSEDKINAIMDFFVNKLGKESSLLARRPQFLSLSLEKRIIPRYSVVQFLLSKGLIVKDFSLSAVFEPTEKMFLDKFVNAYTEKAPELLKLYQKKVNASKKQDCIREESDSCIMPTS